MQATEEPQEILRVPPHQELREIACAASEPGHWARGAREGDTSGDTGASIATHEPVTDPATRRV